MDALLAQISTNPWPLSFALFAGFVGLIGAASAWVAHASTSRDRALIKRSEIALTSAESWDGAHSYNEHDLSKWLQKRGIAADSGVADIIRACWSSWIGCRATTLTELHVLVSRRERSKLPARLSGGIAALLLIIGIVGTLSSVKPVLQAFQFKVDPAYGQMPSSDDSYKNNPAVNTDRVNSLMRDLGDAFLPSLVALIATIAVVTFRGMYSLSLNRYTLELDRFAMGTVMPHYRPRSIADEYAEVRSTFGSLAKTIGEREEKFDLVVSQLEKLVGSIEPALSGLEIGVAQMAAAGNTLATKSNSIATNLTRMLGKKSPLYGAVYGFEEIFEKTNDKIEQISDHIKEITADHEKGRAQMIETLEAISGTIENVKGDHTRDSEVVGKTIDSFKALISELPDQTISQVRGSFDSGIKTMQMRLESSLEDQKKEAASTHQVIRDDTRATLGIIKETLAETAEQIVVSAKAIPATLERLDSSLSLASKSLTEATNVIPSMIDRIDSTLSGATERLDEATKAIPAALERVDDMVVRKSEIEETAVKGIRSVAEEAMFQIRNGNHGFDSGGPSVARMTSPHENPTPETPFSDDQDKIQGLPQGIPNAVPRGRVSTRKNKSGGRLSSSGNPDSVDSVSPGLDITGIQDPVSPAALRWDGPGIDESEPPAALGDGSSGAVKPEPPGSLKDESSGSVESEHPAALEEDSPGTVESEPSALLEEDTKRWGFFSKMFRRS